jgi:hypothetical protein
MARSFSSASRVLKSMCCGWKSTPGNWGAAVWRGVSGAVRRGVAGRPEERSARPCDRPCAVRIHACANSSGTSPNAFSTTASSNSPMLGSPLRENATTPAFVLVGGHHLRAPDRRASVGTFYGLSGSQAALLDGREGQRHVIDHRRPPIWTPCRHVMDKNTKRTGVKPRACYKGHTLRLTH